MTSQNNSPNLRWQLRVSSTESGRCRADHNSEYEVIDSSSPVKFLGSFNPEQVLSREGPDGGNLSGREGEVGNLADRARGHRLALSAVHGRRRGPVCRSSSTTSDATMEQRFAPNSLISNKRRPRVPLPTSIRRWTPIRIHNVLRIPTFPCAVVSHLKRLTRKFHGDSPLVHIRRRGRTVALFRQSRL